VAVTRREPLRFIFLALIACFQLPPPSSSGTFRTYGVRCSHARTHDRADREKVFASSTASEPLFPTKSLLIAWLLCIPCVVFSQFPLLSLLVFIVSFAAYVFFLFALDELDESGGSNDSFCCCRS